MGGFARSFKWGIPTRTLLALDPAEEAAHCLSKLVFELAAVIAASF
jgi:hypothetical protein